MEYIHYPARKVFYNRFATVDQEAGTRWTHFGGHLSMSAEMLRLQGDLMRLQARRTINLSTGFQITV
jgi:hypothetical protein